MLYISHGSEKLNRAPSFGSILSFEWTHVKVLSRMVSLKVSPLEYLVQLNKHKMVRGFFVGEYLLFSSLLSLSNKTIDKTLSLFTCNINNVMMLQLAFP